MAYRTASRRASTPRWMDLRYRGSCQVCKKTLMAGTRAFYDPRDRSVTCTGIACAEEAGITEQKWIGSPVSGQFVTVLSEYRLESAIGEAPPPRARRRSWELYRCTHEDRPCCGCDSDAGR